MMINKWMNERIFFSTETAILEDDHTRRCPEPSWCACRGVLKRGKKKFLNGSFAKRLRVAHMFNHGWWRLAVGGWQLVVGGHWRWLVVGGWWRLAVVGGWRLVVAG